MQSNRDFVLDHILINEGGYAERANEPGGAVNRGITFLEFQAWRKRHGQDPSTLTFKDLRDMPRAETEDIYEADYLAPVRFDQLPGGVDYALADFAVNGGVANALQTVREKLGFTRSQHDPAWRVWRMEPELLWALKSHDPKVTITQICDARWEKMEKRPDFARWKEGWGKRLDRVRADAARLVAE